MTAQEKMKEWFMICIVAAISLSMLGGFLSCLDIEAEKQRQWEKENPGSKIKDILKSDKREESTTTSTSTDPVIDGSKYNTN